MGRFGSGPTASTPIAEKCHNINIRNLADSLASLADADRHALSDEHPADDLAELPIPYHWSDEHGHGEEVASVGLYPVWDGDHRFRSPLTASIAPIGPTPSMAGRHISGWRTP